MPERRAAARLPMIALTLLAFGCVGEGCDCLADLEGDFPLLSKQQAGVQVRVTDNGFSFISDNALDLLSEQLGDTLEFPVPADCSSDPTVCCGYPEGFCSMELDLKDYGEGSHIEVEALDQTGNRLGITLYPRVRTLRPMPARTYGPLGGAIDCNVEFNTRWAGTRWMWIYFEVILGENSESGELGVTVTTANVGGISSSDINIYGDFLCRFGSEQDAIDGIASGFSSQVPGAVEEFLCTTCDDDSGCAAGASCDDGVCRSDATGDCQQSFAIAGRHRAGDLLGPLLGQALSKNLDVYFAAGGDAVSEDDGLSLAVTSGMEPGSSPAEHGCVPVQAAPPPTSMPFAEELRGNNHPVTGAPYDLGAGLHVDALNRGAWAAHQAGYICLNLGTQTVEMLETDAMLLVAPSLGNILEEREKQLMYVLVRPQTAPVIALGDGTFTEGDGDAPAQIDDPLIKIGLTDLELDFYAFIDQRYARIFTIVADADIGVSLDVDADGGLLPLLDDPGNALSNIRAKNVVFLAETEAEVAERIPSILGVALGGLSSDLGTAIELPEVAGLSVSLGSGAFASTSDYSRLAMFADLAPAAASPARQVETNLVSATLDRGASALTVEVEGDAAGAIEWQFRIAGGFWSPFTKKRRATIRRAGLAVVSAGLLEVRARSVGKPGSLDRSPAHLDFAELAAPEGKPGEPIAFHGESEGGGCGECSSSSTGLGAGSALLALVALLLAFGRRRAAVALAAIAIAATLPACSCGDSGGESDPNDPNQVQPGPVGRWVSADADGSRAVAVAYERGRGDLVMAELREDGEPRYRAIDGVPEGPVTKDPEGYRDGIDASGADVGAWASVKIANGEIIVAYQDRDRRSLKLAHETGENRFEFVDVDVPAGEGSVGRYASLAAGPGGALGIAYMAVSVADSDAVEMVTTELRFASASSPSGPWTIETVSTATAEHAARLDVPAGIGLWASLAYRDSGPAIAHYDSRSGDLIVSWKSEEGWSSVVVDGEGSDRGQHASLAAGDGDELFVAYQDADRDRLLLRRIGGAEIDPEQLVDSGQREGDRNHPVGASARVVVTGAEVVVAYQDSADSTLWLARRARAGGDFTTAVSETAATGFGIGLAARDGSFWTASGVYEAAESRLEATRW